MKSFVECLERYLDDCVSNEQSEATVAGKRSLLQRFIGWALSAGALTPPAVTRGHLDAYKRYLLKEHRSRTGKPIDVATRRNHLTTVVVFLRYLREQEVIPTDPGAYLRLPRLPRRLSQVWLTEREAEAVFRLTELFGPPGVRDRAMLETLYATGIRRMELVGLDVDDVNFSEQTLKVNRGKGGKDRYVPIAERACVAIRRYLAEVRPRIATLTSGRALFLTNDGTRFKLRQASRLVKQYVAHAGVGKRGACNLFRHSTATLMLKNGADLRHIQEMLGHADISTTQIYTHVEISPLKKVYRRTHPAARTPKAREPGAAVGSDSRADGELSPAAIRRASREEHKITGNLSLKSLPEMTTFCPGGGRRLMG